MCVRARACVCNLLFVLQDVFSLDMFRTFTHFLYLRDPVSCVLCVVDYSISLL